MIRKLSVNVSDDTIKQIKELQKHELIEKWQPSISDIVRVSIANYYFDMFDDNYSENNSLTNKTKTAKIKE